MTLESLKRSGITEFKDDDGTVEPMTEEILQFGIDLIKEYKTWECSEQYYNNEGHCQIQWNCSLAEWTSWCSGQTPFATSVLPQNRLPWAFALIILVIEVTADIYDHLLYMR